MASRNVYATIAIHGEPPTVRYSITAAAIANLKCLRVTQGVGEEVVEATYVGTGAITLADFNGLPIGSVITDTQAFKTHMKTGATTWKSSAASA